MSRIPKINIGKSMTTDQLNPVMTRRPPNLRRSKSYLDVQKSSTKETGPNLRRPLRANVATTNARITLKENMTKPAVKLPMIPAKGALLKNGVKRPAEKAETQVKLKVAKKAVKVPDWDYKTRFNMLNEKHKTLLNEHKDFEKNISVINTLTSENEELRKKVMEFEPLKAENENLEKSLECLKQKNAETMKQLNEIITQKDEISKNNDLLMTENVNIKTENENFINKLQIIENKLKESERSNKNLLNEIENLKVEIFEGEKKRRYLHNMVQDLKGNIRVFCRLRPPLNEEEMKYICNFETPTEKSLCISRRSKVEWQEFSFDRVFDFGASQIEVFDELSQLVQSALDGYHVCVFAYGQTGSGKTFTMQGESNPELTGMIPRSIDLIFETKKIMEQKGWTYEIRASFLEIYNETVRDLLDLKSDKKMDIRFNEGKGTTVSNLTEMTFRSAVDLMKYMYKAHQNRSTAVTNFNEHSSRSHAVTKIHIEATYNGVTYPGSVSLVDLAGSESAKCASSERLPETKNINKSLSALGNVMLALHKGENHVPFRNSKLTYLLQSSLGGNCKCLMIVNIAPSENSYNESLNALRFGAKVKEVKTGSSRNRIVQSTSQK